MQSAFRAVENLENFRFFVGYEDVTDVKMTSEERSEKAPRSPVHRCTKKDQKKRKWLMEQKVLAVKLSRSIGVAKTIAFLQDTRPDDFTGLSTSTLQYWIHQSKGRKSRYYE
ncbi:hypothetical protein EIN_274640 [Entamoeba invadens IP1]|uniref:Uncharacterized protein n=1 Tax=Entamoeba invadens IP1 TaxID=370355 RepID=A0A0A1U1I7_ENTIV|nr:hypothetical protein EIN_274640 [Entamoeba invadens IP1]ELP87877.1 hypothetical protein EIN_274640 [Entamoeba invadens IP1]|eukprot:XP_004254648.1 hypothetical protein EIN_274640 [Entamoeba invadens IP1]